MLCSLQLFGPDRLFQKEDVAVTKAMQDMAYHSAMMPPVRPIWLDDTSFWLLGPGNAVRRGITATLESRAYQVWSARELTLALHRAKAASQSMWHLAQHAR